MRNWTDVEVNGIRVLTRAGTGPTGHATWVAVCPGCQKQFELTSHSLQRGEVRSCGCLTGSILREKLRSKTPIYTTLHRQMRKARGPARGYSCHDCGLVAAEWSLEGEGTAVSPEGWPYSYDHADYVPRCKSCHVKHDGKKKR